MTTSNRSLAWLGMLALPLLLALVFARPAQVHAVGEQLGRIKGRVVDEQGEPVKNAEVTVDGAALIGEARSVKTDARGRFLFQRLAPGSYEVKVVVGEGEPLLRAAQVQAGGTVSLRIATVDVEVLEVSGAALNMQPDATQTGTTLGFKTMQATPVRYFGEAPAHVPGTTDHRIKGGGMRVLVDGLDITGRGGNVMPFDSVSAIDMITGGGEAQYNSLGGVLNAMTADGSDEWMARVSLYSRRPWMFSRGKAGPAPHTYEQPFTQAPPTRGSNYIAALRVGGPIVKDKLWFDAAYKLLQNVEPPFMASPLGVPPYNIQHPSFRYTTQGARLKLQYAPSFRHRFRLSANTSPATWDNQTRANNRLGAAETAGIRQTGFMIGSWDYTVNEDITTTLQMGLTRSIDRWGPQGRLREGRLDFVGCELFSSKNCTYDPNRPQHKNLVDGSLWYQGPDERRTFKHGFQFDPSVSIHGRFVGTHDIKVGIQASTDYRSDTVETPGGFIYQDRKPGAKLEAGLCDPADPSTHDACYRRVERPGVSTATKAQRVGFYLQDRWWTPVEWLHVLPGIRFDYGATYDNLGQRVTSMSGFGPRLGLAADITGDSRNVISAYYGRHTEPTNVGPARRLNDAWGRTITTWEWEDMTRDFTKQVSRQGGEGGVSVDPNATMPHSDEITLLGRRALSDGFMLSAEYTYKKISNLWALVETNRIWDPTGSRVIGSVDGQNAGTEVLLYTTPADNYTVYQGASLTLNGNPTPGLTLLGFYTLAFAYGPGGGYGNLRQRRFQDGFLGHDVRHLIHLVTTYESEFFSLGALVDYQTGRPRSKTFYREFGGSYSNLRSPRGTLPLAPNDISSISEFRTPARLNIDLRTSIVVPTHLGRLRLHFDIFNLLNTRTPTSIATADRANFGQITGRQRARSFRLGMDYEY